MSRCLSVRPCDILQKRLLNLFMPGGRKINLLFFDFLQLISKKKTFYVSSFYQMINLVCGDPKTKIWKANVLFKYDYML